MTRAAHMDQQVHSLLSLESYRSPWFPTRRLGQDALVAIAAPSRQQSDVSVVPSTWFAVTPDFRSLLVFARTSVVTPLSDFQPAPVEPLSTALASREAHAALWRLSETAWPDFFAHRCPTAGLGSEVEAALDATVPSQLQPWLRQCCADYFDWIV